MSKCYHSLLLSGAAGRRMSSAPARLAARVCLLTSCADKGSHTEPTKEGTTGACSFPFAWGGGPATGHLIVALIAQ